MSIYNERIYNIFNHIQHIWKHDWSNMLTATLTMIENMSLTEFSCCWFVHCFKLKCVCENIFTLKGFSSIRLLDSWTSPHWRLRLCEGVPQSLLLVLYHISSTCLYVPSVLSSCWKSTTGCECLKLLSCQHTAPFLLSPCYDGITLLHQIK